MKDGTMLRVFPAVLIMCACMAMFATVTASAQVACDKVGDHKIKVFVTQGSGQLVDCEAARISKNAKHKITWQVSGKDTLTIEFAPGQNPFLNFSCKNKKLCTAGQIAPGALGQYKYTVTLTSGGKTYVEDPGVIIESE